MSRAAILFGVNLVTLDLPTPARMRARWADVTEAHVAAVIGVGDWDPAAGAAAARAFLTTR